MQGGGGAEGGAGGLEGAVAIMNACIFRRISEEELGGDQSADPSDAFAAAVLSLARGEGMITGGTGFSESVVRGGGVLFRMGTDGPDSNINGTV